MTGRSRAPAIEMKTSFDEIKRMSFRALDAGGAPAGVDEDSAINTAWMEASGLPGLALLGDALDVTARNQRRAAIDPHLDGTGALVDAGGCSAVFLGPGLIDLMSFLAEEHGPDAKLAVSRLCHAGFLIGFIGQAQARGVDVSMVPADAGAGAADVLLTTGNQPGMPDWAHLKARRDISFAEGIAATDADFDKVYTYSREILVPETEESRLSGAGAGLTDND